MVFALLNRAVLDNEQNSRTVVSLLWYNCNSTWEKNFFKHNQTQTVQSYYYFSFLFNDLAISCVDSPNV